MTASNSSTGDSNENTSKQDAVNAVRLAAEARLAAVLSGSDSVESFCEWLITTTTRTNEPVASTIKSTGPAVSGAIANAADSLSLDFDRSRRCGFGEVIYGDGKSFEQTSVAIQGLLGQQDEVLVTRVPDTIAELLLADWPHVRWDRAGKTLRVNREIQPLAPEAVASVSSRPRVGVLTAGTTDNAVFRETVETLTWMQIPTYRAQDVGVAGPYRLHRHLESLRSCVAVVVIAGMEGALPSVVGGHLDLPIIAVPTSVGYGASFGGATALLSMMSSCASNVSVVNIDAGFCAAYVAGTFVHTIETSLERLGKSE